MVYDSNSNEKRGKKEEETILRKIFLNLLILAFIILCYYYISEIFGSISSFYLVQSDFFITFGMAMFLFAFLSVLAGPIQGFASGFLAELLYQLSFYDQLYWEWCLLVGLFGLASGVYKYKPLKYMEGKNVYYTFLIFIIISMIFMSIIWLIGGSDLGISFFIQLLISVVFIVPILLVAYDKVFASKEREIYNELLTHHLRTQADHTIYLIFGRTKIYFCTRCSGLVIGGLLAIFWTHLLEQITDATVPPEFAVLMCILLPIPGLIDWGTQRLLYRTSTTASRLLTGFIIGQALQFLSYTRKYFAFMTFILILYFGIFFLLMFFGNRKEMRQVRKEIEKMSEIEEQRLLDEGVSFKSEFGDLNIIFAHGMESSGHGPKANLLRNRIPTIMTPDFTPYSPGMPYQELLEARMAQFNAILKRRDEWIIIGSSFGGLMAALYACKHPEKIKKLILLAPYLQVPELKPSNFQNLPLDFPVIIYHSKTDKIVNQMESKKRAEELFSNIIYNVVEDEHRLQVTAEKIDWERIL